MKALMIVCLLSGLILRIYCFKGRTHDFALYKKSKTAIAPQISITADLGFLGLKKIHHNSILPFRASKLKALSKAEKKINRQISQKRVLCENKYRECKIFRIVKDVYRGKHTNYGLNWNLIAALVNFKNATLNLNFATP